jgi:hypothetical protein
MVELLYLHSMKHILLLSLLALGVAGCKKEEPERPDPFLGHWQADTIDYTMTTPRGVVEKTFSVKYSQTLDITATTIIFTYVPIAGGPLPTSSSFTYTRNDEELKMTSGVWPTAEIRVLSLTPTSFTHEDKQVNQGGGYIITRIPYHR